MSEERITIYFLCATGENREKIVTRSGYKAYLKQWGLPEEIELIKRVTFANGTSWRCPNGTREEQKMYLEGIL